MNSDSRIRCCLHTREIQGPTVQDTQHDLSCRLRRGGSCSGDHAVASVDAAIPGDGAGGTFLIFCTVLHPVVDVTFRVDVLESGRTYTGVPSTVTPAGKGINVAKVVRSLGEEVTVVGLMPEDSSRQFGGYLDNLGIESHFLIVPGNVRVNVTVLEGGPGGGVTHINSHGTRTIAAQEQGKVVSFVEERAGAGDFWALSGSLCPGLEPGTYGRLIEALKSKGAVTLLDSSGEALRMGVMARPTMVKPNQTELEEYFREEIRGLHHIALRVKRLVDAGIEYVFVSLGAEGVVALHGNDCLLCAPPPVQAVDTVGCGDALVAGLLVGKKLMCSFPEMCRLAVACGVSNALHHGAGVVDREEVWRLAEDVSITAV